MLIFILLEGFYLITSIVQLPPQHALEVNKNRTNISNHQFMLHILEQTKHHTRDIQYGGFNWYILKLWWLYRMVLIDGGGRESTNILGVLNLPKKSFEKTFTKIE